MNNHTKTVGELRAWLHQFMAQDEVEIYGDIDDDGHGSIRVNDSQFTNRL